jgi:hypothetical protein
VGQVVNLNFQPKLMSAGHTPVWRCPPHRPEWAPTKRACTWGKGPHGFWIQWDFTLPSDLLPIGGDEDPRAPAAAARAARVSGQVERSDGRGVPALFFAFAHPYSTHEVEQRLRAAEKAAAVQPSVLWWVRARGGRSWDRNNVET